MLNDGDNEHLPHHPIRSADRPLSVSDRALLASPEARELAGRYPAWGRERLLAEIRRRTR
jgi:hypothetical protein